MKTITLRELSEKLQAMGETAFSESESFLIVGEEGSRLAVLVIPPADPQVKDYTLLRAENLAETGDGIKPQPVYSEQFLKEHEEIIKAHPALAGKKPKAKAAA